MGGGGGGGGPMSHAVFKNANVACLCCIFSPVLYLKIKKKPMSHVPFFELHVASHKGSCCPVEKIDRVTILGVSNIRLSANSGFRLLYKNGWKAFRFMIPFSSYVISYVSTPDKSIQITVCALF